MKTLGLEKETLQDDRSDGRLCSISKLRDARSNFLCKRCVLENKEKERLIFKTGLEKYTMKYCTLGELKKLNTLLVGYQLQLDKNTVRVNRQYIQNTTIIMDEKNIGIASKSTY